VRVYPSVGAEVGDSRIVHGFDLPLRGSMNYLYMPQSARPNMSLYTLPAKQTSATRVRRLFEELRHGSNVIDGNRMLPIWKLVAEDICIPLAP